MPLVSVVLPAPRSPSRRTTPCSGRMRARSRPAARVSSAECVSTTKLIHGAGELIEQIGGEHGLFSPSFRTEFATASMQPDRGEEGALPVVIVRRGRMLGDESGDHAGEDVA